MKILMCNSFYYMRGGAERCYLSLMDLLENNGHEVIPFSMDHEQNPPSPYSDYFYSYIDFPTELSKSGIRPKLRVAERVLYSREAKANIQRLIKDTKPDIAHVHGIAHETSPSILAALKEAGVPTVQTLHDYKLICPNSSFISNGEICERCKGRRYFNAVRHRCKRGSLSASMLSAAELYFHKYGQMYEGNVDIFITPSEFLKHKLIEHGVQNPIIQLPNFIDIDSFQPHSEPEDYFVFYGRLVAIKGVHTLLKAMQAVNHSHLYIAGNGESEAELRAFATENDLDNVTFLGHLSADRLVPLIQRAAFTVVPSEWYENYSMTVIESLACGTPVIGARIGGIPEQIIDGWNGLLFEPGDEHELANKINKLLNSPELVSEMGRHARQRVEEINSPAYHYKHTLAIYERLLGQRTGVVKEKGPL